jgi:hypothetical protein
MAHLKLLSAAFLAFSTSNAQGLLQARNPYYGGYALPGTPEDGAVNGCPSGTLTCSNEVFTFCCPNFTFCGPYGLGPYCCPTCESLSSPIPLSSSGTLTHSLQLMTAVPLSKQDTHAPIQAGLCTKMPSSGAVLPAQLAWRSVMAIVSLQA